MVLQQLFYISDTTLCIHFCKEAKQKEPFVLDLQYKKKEHLH